MSEQREHPNALTARRCFEAWNTGRLDVLRAAFAENVVLRFAGHNALSGTYRGRDAVMEALARASQGGGPRAELEALLASDDHVMAYFHTTAERDGKTLDIVMAEAMTFAADGKCTDVWFLANDQTQYDQFWS
jgi:ketosteroid isomerase-like protein